MKRIALFYTFEEVQLARWILATRHKLSHRDIDVQWAFDIRSYFRAYVKVCRLFHKRLGDWQLSVKGVWQCIRRFRSAKDIFSLLRSMRRKGIKFVPRTTSKHTYRSNKAVPRTVLATEGYPVTFARPKTSKHNLRMKCTRIADSLQSGNVM